MASAAASVSRAASGAPSSVICNRYEPRGYQNLTFCRFPHFWLKITWL